MIKKFKEYISEGLWRQGIDRAKNNEPRKEVGKKVKTELGDDLILPVNSTCDYERVIQLLLDASSKTFNAKAYRPKVQDISSLPYAVKNDKRRWFPIKQFGDRKDNCIWFISYGIPIVAERDFRDCNLEEDDYYAIVDYLGKHLADKELLEGTMSKPILYYIGTFDRETADNVRNYMRKQLEDEDDIEFYSLSAPGSLSEFDVCLVFNYRATLLYDEIKEIANEYISTLDSVNEGMWKDGVNRAKNNVDRTEDKIDSNVYELKPVDLGLPFLVANRSLSIKDKVDIYFREFETSTEREKIEKLGWRLPTPDEMDRILSSNISATTIQAFDFFSLKKRGNQVTIGPHHGLDNLRLWCPEQNNSPSDPFSKIFIIDYYKPSKVIHRIKSSQPKYQQAEILLVRDKEEVNEGLWKTGVERAKSSKDRIEDGVKLEIGTRIIVKNRTYDYNSLIKFMFDNGPEGHDVLVEFGKLGTYAGQVYHDLKTTGESETNPAYFRINDRGPKSDVVELMNYGEWMDFYDGGGIDEDDYRAMCRGIAERMRQLGEIVFVRGNGMDVMKIFDIDENKPHANYRGRHFFDAFRKHFGDKFHEVITSGEFIALEVDYDCLRYYEDAVKFTQEYMDKLDNDDKEI